MQTQPYLDTKAVFEYLTTDPQEQLIYKSIITNICQNAQNLENNLNDANISEIEYANLMENIKKLSSLVMLRKFYIMGIMPSPRG